MTEKKDWKTDMAGVHKFINLENPGEDISMTYRTMHIRVKHGQEKNVPKIFLTACLGYAVSKDTLATTNIRHQDGEQYETVDRPRYMAVKVETSTDPEQIAKERAMDEADVPRPPKEKKKGKRKSKAEQAIEDEEIEEEEEAREDRKIHNVKEDILEDV
ncbi:MAG: hypothetical protein V3V59_02875 [Thermodesulfovibrionales bacterium]